MSRVLVVGAAGYLGTHVVEEFKRRGDFVRVVVRRTVPDKIAAFVDETHTADITNPAQLAGACDGIDVVFSSAGLMNAKSKQTFLDVDYQGNKNLLDVAMAAKVKKFIYVSVFNGPKNEDLAIVHAHEEFARALAASGMSHTVLRPTGYYSDMGEFFKMAQSGRAFLFGDGLAKLNPIHGADLAEACANAVDGTETAIDIGGPEALTFDEIAGIAFEVLGTPAKISHVPLGIAKATIGATRLWNRNQAEILAFLVRMTTTTNVAPSFGTRKLKDHFATLAKTPEKS